MHAASDDEGAGDGRIGIERERPARERHAWILTSKAPPRKASPTGSPAKGSRVRKGPGRETTVPREPGAAGAVLSLKVLRGSPKVRIRVRVGLGLELRTGLALNRHRSRRETFLN
jgi:hypothetical protein